MTMRNGLVPQGEKFKKRVAGSDLSQYKVVQNGQLVVGFPIDEAVLAFQRSIPAGIVSPAYAVWDVIDEGAVDHLYLERFLRSPSAIAYYLAKLQGSTARRRSLPNPVFLDMDVPLPPLDEQRRIAAILNKADELRIKRREALAHLDSLTQSIFHSTFGDPVNNPHGLPRRTLPEVGHLYSGGTPSKTAPENWEGEVPWFSPKDIKSSFLDDSMDHISPRVTETTSLKLLPPKTVVLVVRGMILAHSFPVAVLRRAATINQDLKAVRPYGPIEPEFLLACLQAQHSHAVSMVETAAHGTKRLTADGLAKIFVFDVPLKRQQDFARQVSAVERLKETHRKHLAELDALFASLHHRAFKGEL